MKSILTSISVFALLLFSLHAQSQQQGTVCSDPISIQCGDVVNGVTANIANDNLTSGASQCVYAVGTAGQIWYAYTATESSLVSAFTCGSATNFDTEIHVYTGTCGSLTCVTGNDDGCANMQSTLSFSTQPGVTYLIRVGGFGTSAGGFGFSVVCSDYQGGCTNPSAVNYDASATFDDGTCLYEGCTDPGALNYNPTANLDDGSCTYCDGAGSTLAQMYVCTYANGYQVNIDILDSNGNIVFNVSNLGDNQIYYFDMCLSPGECYTVNMTNAAGSAGWSNGYFWINSNNIQVINQALDPNTTSETSMFSLDGTCTAVLGCTDSTATNYNQAANIDDGTCVYAPTCDTGTLITLNMFSGTFPNECSFVIVDALGSVVYSSPQYTSSANYYDSVCLPDGCYTIIMNDTFGDGWNSGYLNVYINQSYAQYSITSGSTGVGVLPINAEGCVPNVSTGCTNPAADNYEPTAIYDDGSCQFTGCTDVNAINFDAYATADDGSCEYCNGEGSINALLYICTYSYGEQVELQIADDQGNIVYYASNLPSGWITNVNICLQAGVCYTATMINNTGPYGWYGGYFWINTGNAQIVHTQPLSTDQSATVTFSIDGTCGDIFGCTDPQATNYNPEATIDDASCYYLVYGCTDPAALNYNIYATADDGSCVYSLNCESNEVAFQYYSGTFVSEGSFDVVDANGVIMMTGGGVANSNVSTCLPDGCYTLNMYDSWGDGWVGSANDMGYVNVFVNGAFVGQFTLDISQQFAGSVSFGVNAEACTPMVTGCTDPTALNYNPLATEEDGSCQYPENCDGNLVTITIVTQTFGSEISWSLIAEDGSIAASGSGYSSWNYYSQSICLPDGCYQLQMNDSWGDGWNGAYYMINAVNAYYEGSLFYGLSTTDLIGVNTNCGEIAGCTDADAVNYNAAATFDDGSCFYNTSDPGINFNINDNTLELEFNLYPNPTNGGIIVDLNNLDYSSDINVNVRSLDGKLVSSQFVANSDNFRRFNMDLTQLSAGYYFVQVTNGENMKTLPLIKQ